MASQPNPNFPHHYDWCYVSHDAACDLRDAGVSGFESEAMNEPPPAEGRRVHPWSTSTCWVPTWVSEVWWIAAFVGTKRRLRVGFLEMVLRRATGCDERFVLSLHPRNEAWVLSLISAYALGGARALREFVGPPAPGAPRDEHEVFAGWAGYFWLPCPWCKRVFGGHEWDGCGIPCGMPGGERTDHGTCGTCSPPDNADRPGWCEHIEHGADR